MDLKRYFRGPVVWIFVAVIVVLLMVKFVSVGDAPKNVSLGRVNQLLVAGNQVSKATIKDKEQQIVLKLKDGTSVQASYPVHGDTALVAEIEKDCKLPG